MGRIVDALGCAATDDQFQPCVIGFGSNDPARAAVCASDGHVIFWIAGVDSAEALLGAVARGRECVQTTLHWPAIMPPGGVKKR